MLSYRKFLKSSNKHRKLVSEIEEVLNPKGVTPNEWLILSLIDELPGCHLLHLSEQMEVTAPQITALTKTLHDKGLIELSTSFLDKRRKIAHLTNKGQQILA